MVAVCVINNKTYNNKNNNNNHNNNNENNNNNNNNNEEDTGIFSLKYQATPKPYTINEEVPFSSGE